MSTRNPEDLKHLRDFLISQFEQDMLDEEFLVEYSKKGAVGEIRAKLRVLSENHNEKGFIFKVRGSEKNLSTIKQKFGLKNNVKN